MISNADFNALCEQVSEVISTSQHIASPKIRIMMEDWKKNKEYFMQLWGGMTYQHPEPIAFPLSKEEKAKKFTNFVDFLLLKGHIDLASFLKKNQISFFNNIVVSPYNTENKVYIPMGAKIVKSFKHFIQDEVELQALQQAAATIIQTDRLEGYLCFSVHPLDFLSMSENASAWTTCHGLKDDYRAGILSYIADSTTFLCYLKSAKSDMIPISNFPDTIPWNDKKWRMVMYLSDTKNMILTGRPYPYNSSEILKFLETTMIPNSKLGYFTPWLNQTYYASIQGDVHITAPYHTFIIPNVGFRSINELMQNQNEALNFTDALMFNDITNMYHCFRLTDQQRKFAAAGHKYIVYPSKPDEIEKAPQFHLAGATCCQCGEQKIETPFSMRCPDCIVADQQDMNSKYFFHCSKCEEMFYYKRGIQKEPYNKDSFICYDCLKEESKYNQW